VLGSRLHRSAGGGRGRLDRYVERVDDESDGRRKLVRLTPRGIDSLVRSAAIFDDLRAQWAETVGANQLREMEAALRTMVPLGAFRLDVPGWFGV
jgi:DNA-binding MarR family transcriptional regulator